MFIIGFQCWVIFYSKYLINIIMHWISAFCKYEHSVTKRCLRPAKEKDEVACTVLQLCFTVPFFIVIQYFWLICVLLCSFCSFTPLLNVVTSVLQLFEHHHSLVFFLSGTSVFYWRKIYALLTVPISFKVSIFTSLRNLVLKLQNVYLAIGRL